MIKKLTITFMLLLTIGCVGNLHNTTYPGVNHTKFKVDNTICLRECRTDPMLMIFDSPVPVVVFTDTEKQIYKECMEKKGYDLSKIKVKEDTNEDR